MPKPSPRRRPNQPLVPIVSAETWKALVAAAAEFQRLAPWEWMHDSQVIGMRQPGTGEMLLGSIVGRLRQVFGLLVYRREAGHRWLLDAILNDGDPDTFDENAAYEQDLVKAELVPKRELTREDKAVLADTGFAPATQRGALWPQFRSLTPGGYPWHVTQHEAETLLFALPRVAAMASLTQRFPALWADHGAGDIGFLPEDFNPVTGDLQPDQLDWQPMVPPPAPRPESVSLDDETAAGLLKLTQAKGCHLELDVAYAPFPMAHEDRPRFPRLALAVERTSGFIGGVHLSDFTDTDGAGGLGKVLQRALTQLGCRPETFRVQRARSAAMLRPLAAHLGIPVILEPELAQLNAARASLARFSPS